MKITNWTDEFQKPLIIAGPCSAESEEQMLNIASQLPSQVQIFRAGIWKPRTKPNSFEGVGSIGFQWLKKVKDQFGLKITTEVATANHVKIALENDVDILWIGARTTVNPFQVQEIADALQGTDKIVLVKNPVNPDLDLWIGALERLNDRGITKLGAIHRGFSTYKKEKYRNQPQWQIPLDFKNQFPQIPLLCDPSHISGNRDLVEEIAQKAFNFGFDGLFVESHHIPEKAWSDAAQQVTPEKLKNILDSLTIRSTDDPDIDFHLELARLRNRIDDKDRAVLEILAKRMEIAKEIGNLKKEHNVTVYQPKRWTVLREFMMELAQTHGFSDKFIEDFIIAVHQESIRIQNKVMTDKIKQ